jgi:hypothetical protein
VLAAREWGRTLARLHRRNRTATVDVMWVHPLGPYRFAVSAAAEGILDEDAAFDLAHACDWVRAHVRAPGDARACVAAFLDGYRGAGGVVLLGAASA